MRENNRGPSMAFRNALGKMRRWGELRGETKRERLAQVADRGSRRREESVSVSNQSRLRWEVVGRAVS